MEQRLHELEVAAAVRAAEEFERAGVHER
jgi:hypothetical protein